MNTKLFMVLQTYFGGMKEKQQQRVSCAVEEYQDQKRSEWTLKKFSSLTLKFPGR